MIQILLVMPAKDLKSCTDEEANEVHPLASIPEGLAEPSVWNTTLLIVEVSMLTKITG